MPARPEPAAPVWRVVSVHDGDTLRAIDEGKVEQRIRLAGIDAPERGQAFGNVSRERLAALTMGQPVEVYIEDRDRYGRTVARLEAGGVDVCRQMVADGLAWHFTRYSDDPALAAAEIEARAERRGLWRDPAPVAPWDWRAGEAERKRQRAGRLPR
jgi:endonuclease YncB( thermonuclease family)